jgi:anion-transporting  ArsA/GET3 family ATPase
MGALDEIIGSRRILICAGPGGVGKTTAAASLAVLAARRGRRTVVATIDPAPRLVDALALASLGPIPSPVPVETARGLGVPPGMLAAARIDTQHAFATLVERHVPDPAARQRILTNNIYRQITTTLTGAQEYAAALALFDLHAEGGFDTIVLDTPPSANAIEFFDAPARISGAVTSPLVNWLLSSHRPRRLFSLQRLSSGGGLVLRRLAKLVGSRFLADVGEFLSDFEPVLEGFAARTQAIDQLLHGADVAILGICAPESPSVDEAIDLSTALSSRGLAPQAFIANRVYPRPGLRDARGLEDYLQQQQVPGESNHTRVAHLIERLADDLELAAQSQAREVGRLAQAAGQRQVVSVPLITGTSSPLETLIQTTAHLAGP